MVCGTTDAHLIGILKMQAQCDRAVFSIVAIFHIDLFGLLTGDLGAQSEDVVHKRALIVSNDFNIYVARIPARGRDRVSSRYAEGKTEA